MHGTDEKQIQNFNLKTLKEVTMLKTQASMGG
jgi:hypothetical protein